MKAFFIKIIKIFLIGIGIAALGWIVLIMLPDPVFGPQEDVELGKQVVMSIEESGEQYTESRVIEPGDQVYVTLRVVDPDAGDTHAYSVSDDRFEAVVVPLDRGNLILVGEKNEPLADYQQVVDDNLVWTI